ncbi:MAG TPA: hypothetical protein VFG01_09455 [Acidobacteriota bacterium]|nr:hypothetical protein [Acidobacteriota bacterium]
MIDYPVEEKTHKGGANVHYIGVDHHKQYSYLTVLDEDGSMVKEGRVLNIQSEVKKYLEVAGEGSEAVIEAGRSTYTMLELLEELEMGVKIAHPRGGANDCPCSD